MPGERSMPYVAAIDGLRAIAVALVLGFHAGVPGFGGGFLGVSLFFTLSGYLITQLLLREHDRSGAIALRSFWARRLRRLAPASLACLAAVAVAAGTTSLFPGAAVPGDLVAASLDVANWRFAMAEASYQDLLVGVPSPVVHFWSLAIEEQFYVCFPVIVAFVLRRSSRRLLVGVLLGGWAMGTAASILSTPIVTYHGTHTRMPELLAGAMLALALPIGATPPPRTTRLVAGGGIGGIAVLAVLTAGVAIGEQWLYEGGLAVVPIVWCALVAATVVPGPVRYLCSLAPAVAVGRRSYGVYVYHWPLFIVLDEDRVGTGGAGLVAVRILATLAVAWGSYALLEAPIRHGRRLHRPRVVGAAYVGSLVSVLALAALAPGTGAYRPGGESLARIDAFRAPVDGGGVRQVDVVVTGSEPSVEALVRQVVVDGVSFTPRSELRTGCPLLLPDEAANGCTSFADTMAAAAAGAPDLVVLGIGEAERAAIAAILGAPGARGTDGQMTLDAFDSAREAADGLVAELLAALPDLPVVIVDRASDADPATGDPDFLGIALADEVIGDPDLLVTTADDPVGFGTFLAPVVQPLAADRTRLLVLGDSASLDVAAGLDDEASDRFDVIWGGLENCGVVPTAETRWMEGLEDPSDECPTVEDDWADAVRALRPDAVLVVASLTGLAEQRYEADGPWHRPGDQAWVEAHDRAFADLQSALADSGATTVVLSSPHPASGTGFANGPLAAPERLRAWDAQVRRWDAAWASVAVLDWAGIVDDHEATMGRSVRVDGVHFEPGAFGAGLAEVLVPRLEHAMDSLVADAGAAGCLVGEGGERRLELDRCRVS